MSRDSRRVAKLVRVAADGPKHPRWNPKAHARWQSRISGGEVTRSDAALAAARADRSFAQERR
jgi:hypothetical protein